MRVTLYLLLFLLIVTITSSYILSPELTTLPEEMRAAGSEAASRADLYYTLPLCKESCNCTRDLTFTLDVAYNVTSSCCVGNATNCCDGSTYPFTLHSIPLKCGKIYSHGSSPLVYFNGWKLYLKAISTSTSNCVIGNCSGSSSFPKSTYRWTKIKTNPSDANDKVPFNQCRVCTPFRTVCFDTCNYLSSRICGPRHYGPFDDPCEDKEYCALGFQNDLCKRVEDGDLVNVVGWGPVAIKFGPYSMVAEFRGESRSLSNCTSREIAKEEFEKYGTCKEFHEKYLKVTWKDPISPPPPDPTSDSTSSTAPISAFLMELILA